MENENIKPSAECDPQRIEERVSDFERIATETEAEGALAGSDIHPLTNFLLLLEDPGCAGVDIKFSRDQVKRICEAYSLLNAYHPVPENPGVTFEILKQITEAGKYIEQLLSRSETRG